MKKSIFMKRRIFSLILMGVLFINRVAYANSDLPVVMAKGAVLIEQGSGRVLYQKDAYSPLPMASTTKIMTCILAIEKGNLDDVVTISKRASSAPPVKLHLHVGEKQRLGDLLYALMLQSDNDAAVAVAEHIGGSVEGFCEQMTQKAQEIGAKQTVFKTPNGLDAEGHYSTAYDMAVIAAYALDNPEFVKIVTTELISIPTVEVKGSHRYDLQNKNRFFYSYPGANGVKTGFTNKAGHCFVGAANREGMQLVGTALASGWGKKGKSQKYTDVIRMMDYGFKNYKLYVVVEKNPNYMQVPVEKGVLSTTTLSCDKEIVLPLTEQEKDSIVVKKIVSTPLCAPIKVGEQLGEIEVICEGNVLAKTPLKATEEIKKASILDYIKKWIGKNE